MASEDEELVGKLKALGTRRKTVLERDQKVRDEIRGVVEEAQEAGGPSMAECARLLGISRQGLYGLLSASNSSQTPTSTAAGAGP
jgi:hypothetical protein